MSEMAVVAQHLVVIDRGRLVADTGVAEFIASAARDTVRVRTTEPDRLAGVLRAHGGAVSAGAALTVTGLTTDRIGTLAAAAGITLLELAAQPASLEDAFVDLTTEGQS
jgi:ABC-2 type transport system ATP-binding protein